MVSKFQKAGQPERGHGGAVEGEAVGSSSSSCRPVESLARTVCFEIVTVLHSRTGDAAGLSDSLQESWMSLLANANRWLMAPYEKPNFQ